MVKKSDKYIWQVGTRPPPIDPHSIVKHDIVKDYLGRYITVLMSNFNIEKLTLSIVDGFAGGGEYCDEKKNSFHDGSPLIVLDTVREQEVLLNLDRVKPRKIDAKYYFVENNPANFEYLKQTLGARIGHKRLINEVVMLNDDFQNVLQPIIRDISRREGGQRALFLLDQYAYDQVSGKMLRAIFSEIKNPEVILTFNVDSLISFLSDTKASRAKLEEIGLDKYIEWSIIDSLKLRSRSVWRSVIQRNLARGLLEASGARHYTIFYITPIGSTSWTYWLIHLSNNFKARDVMMDLHWKNANHFSHYLEPDIFTLGYRAGNDAVATLQESIDFGEEYKFDSYATLRCRNGLTEKLTPVIYENRLHFGDLLEAYGSRTPATSEMIKEALDPIIQSGDIKAVSPSGVVRRKGTSIKVADILERSPQKSFSFGRFW